MSFLYDTFTESSDTALASHTPETGSSWAIGTSSWTVYEATDEVGVSAGLRGYAWNAATPPSADYHVEVNGKTDSTNAARQFGPRGRGTAYERTNANSNCYYVQLHGDAIVYMFKEVAGTITQIGSSYTIPSFGSTTYYTVKLEMIGSAIATYIDGVSQITATDTAVTAANLAGLYFRNENPRITYVDAVDLAAGGANPKGPLGNPFTGPFGGPI